MLKFIEITAQELNEFSLMHPLGNIHQTRFAPRIIQRFSFILAFIYLRQVGHPLRFKRAGGDCLWGVGNRAQYRC